MQMLREPPFSCRPGALVRRALGGESASLQVSMMEAWTIRKRKRKKAAFVEGNKLCSRPAGCSLGLSAVCTLSREGERREQNLPIAPCSLPVWPGTHARQRGSTRSVRPALLAAVPLPWASHSPLSHAVCSETKKGVSSICVVCRL